MLTSAQSHSHQSNETKISDSACSTEHPYWIPIHMATCSKFAKVCVCSIFKQHSSAIFISSDATRTISREVRFKVKILGTEGRTNLKIINT